MKITFEKLAEVIFEEITAKLENNSGVSIFAKERAKFEGWLKVELCESLSRVYPNLTPTIIPEKERIDITFNGWAIELNCTVTSDMS